MQQSAAADQTAALLPGPPHALLLLLGPCRQPPLLLPLLPLLLLVLPVLP